ncbi:hypothetical protein NIE88_01565 [Sporolactobacillus shoreicorticis]|uniref:Uncharacterized protein n=1 Tax=Sporolactobacillus shoreicorticis TaxID=1923877 RepID=A0ABW5S5F2_9BACL|nr:hypothetical protein [Sporolactobacillus shoreicorticis]MCO7124467.1 hypothetical protein [Sporolactobacillus shoreicorticis]
MIKSVVIAMCLFLLPFSAPAAESRSDDSAAPGTESGTLFIGMDGQFKRFPVHVHGTLTPEKQIQEIARLTGWNLSLAEPVSVGRLGMTVVFSDQASFFKWPLHDQKAEFAVPDLKALTYTILDSVRHTLQYNDFYHPEETDISKLDIYFGLSDDRPFEVPAAGIKLPLDQPYPGSSKLQTTN